MAIAVLIARGGSKRIPKKNLRPLQGVPIISRVIRNVIDTESFAKVYVSTDSPEIASVSLDAGAIVPGLRPAELANDFSTTKEVMGHFIDLNLPWVDQNTDIFCIYPTAIFMVASDIEQALNSLAHDDSGFVICASPVDYHPDRIFLVNKNKRVIAEPTHPSARTQDLGIYFRDVGFFYAAKKHMWLSSTPLLGANNRVIEIPKLRAIDIDTEEDWELADTVFRVRSNE